MFQSHIIGDWNDNYWNEDNYRTFSTTLESLAYEYPLNYTTLGEISEDSKVPLRVSFCGGQTDLLSILRKMSLVVL